MKIFTNTNKPAHLTALKVVPQPRKLLKKSLKLKKPNTHASLGREIYFSVVLGAIDSTLCFWLVSTQVY